MTFVLSCITSDAVFQVVDRKIFKDDGGSYSDLDSDANKAVFVDGRFSFGYSGLAEISGQSTDSWLQERLAEADDRTALNILEHLRCEASKTFKTIRKLSSSQRRIAFETVFWATSEDQPKKIKPGQYVPSIAVVENALDDSFNWQKTARPEFALRASMILLESKKDIHISSIGCPLSTPEKGAIMKHIGRAVRKKNAPPSLTMVRMFEAVDWLRRRGKLVGGGMVGTYIPKTAVAKYEQTDSFHAMYSMPKRDVVCFFDVQEKPTATGHRSPLIVMGKSKVQGASGGRGFKDQICLGKRGHETGETGVR